VTAACAVGLVSASLGVLARIERALDAVRDGELELAIALLDDLALELRAALAETGESRG
jgi:hypothetical protein